MKFYTKILVVLLLFISSYNSAQEIMIFLENPNYRVKMTRELISKIDIIYQNLQDNSPELISQKLKSYGIDPKKQKIKSIKSKRSYFEFDSTGNLISANWGPRAGDKTFGSKKKFLEFTYNNLGNLTRFKDSTNIGFPGTFDTFIINFNYDTLNRIISVDFIGFNSVFGSTKIQYNYDNHNNIVSYDEQNKNLSPIEDSIKKEEEKAVNRFLYGSLSDDSSVKKDTITKESQKNPGNSNFFVYNSDNQKIKSIVNGRAEDSLIYYKDSIIWYHYSPEYNSPSGGYKTSTIDKWIYFIEKNNIVKVTKGIDLQLSRKFDDKNNLIEETNLFYDAGILSRIKNKEYQYYPHGGLYTAKTTSKNEHSESVSDQEFFYDDKGKLIKFKYQYTENYKESNKYTNRKKKYKLKYTYY